MPKPSISIITACLNSKRTIANTIDSVLAQTYHGIEYIIIDGGSTDGTTEIIKSYGTLITKYISGPDRGIYDALNKGIIMATSDIIGILNSDDFFNDNTVIERVAATFDENNIEAVIGDVQFVDPVKTSRVVRYYSSKKFTLGKFRFGIMPAHPGFYARRELFEKYGYYKTDYKIAADFELLLRFILVNRIKFKYLEMPFVSMRTGGLSNKSFMSNITLNKEIARACRENGVKTNYFFIYSKYFSKIFQFFGKRVTR
jgi:glycosyltransferase involved in cell wall biosynthesis